MKLQTFTTFTLQHLGIPSFTERDFRGKLSVRSFTCKNSVYFYENVNKKYYILIIYLKKYFYNNILIVAFYFLKFYCLLKGYLKFHLRTYC